MENKHFIQIITAIIISLIVSAAAVHLHYQRRIGELDSTIKDLQEEIAELNEKLSKYESLTLVDDRGYVLNLTSYPDRIVSLAPSITEILFAVGAGDKVVGVTDYCNYPYNFSAWIEAGNMTSIGSYWNPSIEPIVTLNPDLILASPASEKAANRLRSMGFNVLMLDPKNINDILQDIILVGRATGHDVEASILVRTVRERIDRVLSRLRNATFRPKVYFEVWNDPLMSAGPGTWINELIKLAGGINIFENTTSQWPVSYTHLTLPTN